MFLLCLWSVFLTSKLSKGVLFSNVCYGHYGCFSNSPPFTNAHTYLPEPPSKLQVKLILYTPETGTEKPQIVEDNPFSVNSSRFSSQRPTKLIIHGYQQTAFDLWVKDMVKEIMKREVANIFVVDWNTGGKGILYHQAVANARLVGAVVASIIKTLQGDLHASMNTFHLIGHSLGAHIAGYVGQAVSGLGRISGLDPAGPGFEGTDDQVKLDRSDAQFVDIIHTDVKPLMFLGFGIRQPTGTVDFYVNGGISQPGCPNALYSHAVNLLQGNIRELVSGVLCDHWRAVDIYLSSINECNFYACRTASVHSAIWGHCNTKVSKEFVMGYDAQVTPPGIYYAKTSRKRPFC